MPKRGCADTFSVTLRVVGVAFFIMQIAFFVINLLSNRIDIAGLVTGCLLGLLAFGLGTAIDIALSIEKRLYENK